MSDETPAVIISNVITGHTMKKASQYGTVTTYTCTDCSTNAYHDLLSDLVWGPATAFGCET